MRLAGPERLMTRTGTLVSITEGALDGYGNPTEVETETTVRYELQQQIRDETGPPAAWLIDTWRLFLPAGTDVHGVDRFIDDRGAEFEFDGPPWPVHNPRTGRTSHVEATLKRVT